MLALLSPQIFLLYIGTHVTKFIVSAQWQFSVNWVQIKKVIFQRSEVKDMDTSLDKTHHQVVLARQPIVNTSLAPMGYELLYRKNSDALYAEVIDEVGATAQVVAASLLELGMLNLVGDKKAFINFPRAYLLNPNGVPIDPNVVVIEVLENAQFDPVLLAALRRWKKAGYTIALDDFVFDIKLVPFIELADYIKLDIMALGQDAFHRQVEALRGFKVEIIAEKVETWEEYQFCRLLDIKYLQGYFFEKPELMASKSSRVNSMTLLRLMAAMLNSSEMDVAELERLIGQDAGLVHKLLRFLNSPVTGLMASVDSLRLAITLIGMEKLKSLVNLLLMSEMTGDRHVLLQSIMIRAKHAELLARRRAYDNEDKYFLAGMLSMIDVCVGIRLDKALSELPLPHEFINAIVHRSGRVGQTLNQVEQYRRDHAVESSEQNELYETYLDAIKWSDGFISCV
ncbi:HDOD domain-containing protein [Marinomonas arenicola]|jgi:EAL and modified HD-GYP domain-containing signal transduction protein|uniref:EAL and HDOD domain-containing protein n=1 Tax=Marinomonas sp. KMM3893 TaxID=2530201 RepID=UPI001FB60102|nr:HDOD domain-containing protein [Marinomonas sp. KMM3893]